MRAHIVPVGVPSWMNVANSRAIVTSSPVISRTMRAAGSSGFSSGSQGLLGSDAGPRKDPRRMDEDDLTRSGLDHDQCTFAAGYPGL
jgi:hypothetical protein